jgi:hypothetical protein
MLASRCGSRCRWVFAIELPNNRRDHRPLRPERICDPGPGRLPPTRHRLACIGTHFAPSMAERWRCQRRPKFDTVATGGFQGGFQYSSQRPCHLRGGASWTPYRYHVAVSKKKPGRARVFAVIQAHSSPRAVRLLPPPARGNAGRGGGSADPPDTWGRLPRLANHGAMVPSGTMPRQPRLPMRGGHYAPMARWTRRAAWRSGWHLAPGPSLGRDRRTAAGHCVSHCSCWDSPVASPARSRK